MDRNEQMREELIVFCQRYDPNLVLTLTTHQPWDLVQMRKLVGSFFGRLDRKLLGNAWLERPMSERVDGIAAIEKPGVSVHAHCVVRLEMDRWYDALRASSDIWRKLCPSGHVHFEPISYVRDAVNYCTKESEDEDYEFGDQVVYLQEFHPQPK